VTREDAIDSVVSCGDKDACDASHRFSEFANPVNDVPDVLPRICLD
jgi:hypothetical protein